MEAEPLTTAYPEERGPQISGRQNFSRKIADLIVEKALGDALLLLEERP